MHVRLQISIVLKIHHFPFNESIKLSRVLSYKQFWGIIMDIMLIISFVLSYLYHQKIVLSSSVSDYFSHLFPWPIHAIEALLSILFHFFVLNCRNFISLSLLLLELPSLVLTYFISFSCYLLIIAYITLLCFIW